jgi:DNA polymerase III delta prime subunit
MTTHHAVLFCSENPLTCSVADFYTTAPQDEYRQAQFGIDDVRTLIAHAHRRPDGEDDMRTLLVATEFITEEAQQALLKIVEEPPLSTEFVFVIPEGYSFLPTLESRFDRRGSLSDGVGDQTFSEFLELSHKDRLALIDEVTKKKDHVWHARLKKGLIEYLKDNSTKLPTETLRELEYVSRLLLTRGASNKMLFEHLSLVL